MIFSQIKKLTNIIFGLSAIYIISLQLIYYYNYKNGIKPMDLRVFQMMSGLTASKSIGINDKQIVYKLLNITKFTFTMLRYVNKITFPLLFILFFLLFSIDSTWAQFIFIALPHSLFYAIFGSRTFFIIIYPLFYYLINVIFFKSKLNLINNRLVYISTNNMNFNNSVQFIQNLKQMDIIYNEINEYNKILYSKQLCLYIFYNNYVCACFIYVSLFSLAPLFLKCIMAFFSISIVISFIFFIQMTSNLFNECFNSYKYLNSYLIKNSHKIPIKSKFKVK